MMARQSSRDWIISKIEKMDNVVNVESIDDDFIEIQRKNSYTEEEYPSFTTAIIGTKRVTDESLSHLLDQGHDFQFIANVPKDAIWHGSAITIAQERNLGWGGIGDLMSAMQDEDVEGFQKKEYSFVEDGLGQHTRVSRLDRHFDRLIEVVRHDLPPIKTVLLNEYELTAECIRNARKNYGDFSAILRTNPNGGATKKANEVARELGAGIFQWGQFLGRLNSK